MREYHFSVDPEASVQVGSDQMVELVEIDYSFGLEIGKVVEEVFGHRGGGSIVDESLKQFVEEHRLEFLEAFLAVVYLSVDELLRLRQPQNRVPQSLHPHRDL